MLFGPITYSQNPSLNYPNKQITLVVPYTTGSTADLLARHIGNKLSTKLSVPIIVDNRAGAAGVIGTDFVAKSAPDGYTILFTATSHASVAAIRTKLPYDPVQGFSAISLLATSAMGLVINPNQYTYSSPGTGTTQHLAMELLKQKGGLEILHVPYKGISGAITDLIGGHVQASVVSLQAANTYIQSGQLKMLAIFSEERSKAFPKVPTLKQVGMNEVVDTWYGVLGPAKLPSEIIQKLNTEMNLQLNTPELKDLMDKQGLNQVGGPSERMQNLLQTDISKWKLVVKNGNIKTE
ncbi:MAG: hypothetical protein RIR83_784 [Pseudomonadota bacterium]